MPNYARYHPTNSWPHSSHPTPLMADNTTLELMRVADSLGGQPRKLRGALLAKVAAAPVALAMRPSHGTTRTVGRVLVHLAMLSTASGWMIPLEEEVDEHFFSPHACSSTSDTQQPFLVACDLFSSQASTMSGVGQTRDRRRLWDASNCDGWCASPPYCLSFPPLCNPVAASCPQRRTSL